MAEMKKKIKDCTFKEFTRWANAREALWGKIRGHYLNVEAEIEIER